MNTARINILVNIIRQNPGAIKQVQQEMKALQQQAMRGGAAAGKMFGAFGYLDKLGKDLQWTGRQLEFRFTLPLVAAGYAATKWAMANERAFTQLKKVYQGTAGDIKNVTKELTQLRQAFELLSNIYGVNQEQVITIGKLWAEAGLSGTALAKATRETLNVMILGNLEYDKAAQALIVLRAQYGLTADQLKKEIALINVVENQAAVGFQDLIDGITRAGGTARTVGIDIRHLSSLIAALVPATGSASSAGNGLKTILSRIFAPTAQAAEIMKLAGVNIDDLAWKSANGAKRLEIMAQSFKDLTPNQQAYFSSVVAGRFQINRLDVLLRDIADPLGRYNKALKDTSEETKNLAKYQAEINTLLESDPQQFKQLMVVIQNQLAKAIVPLIPLFMEVIRLIAQAVTWFTELDPAIQKVALGFLIFLAALGPIVAYTGAFILLFSTIGKGFISLGHGIKWAIGWFLRLIGATVATKATATAAAAASLAELQTLTATILAEAGAVATATSGLGVVAGEAFVAGFLGALALGTPQMIAGMGSQIGLLFTPAMTAWAGFGTALGGAFEAAIIAAIVAGTPAKAAAVAAQMAALATGGAAAAGGLAIGAAVETGIVGALGSGAAAAGIGTGIVGAIEGGATVAATQVVNLATWDTLFAAMPRALGPGAASAGWEIGASVVGGFSAGTAGLIAAAGAAFATVMGAIWRTSDNIFDFVAALWIGFFGGLPGLVWAVFRDGWMEGLRGLGEFPTAVWRIVKGVMEPFGKLPEFVANVMQAVIDVLYKAAESIVDALSYLNPFARHSPSLVDLVSSGVDVIIAKYQSLANVDIGKSWRKAAADIQRFNANTKGARYAAQDRDINEDVAQIGKSNPAALGSAQALANDIRVLRGDLEAVAAAYAKQILVVNKWEQQLDSVNKRLDEQQDILRRQKYQLDIISNGLNKAQEQLDKWASAPLVGMRAMDDAIFSNQQHTKELQLALMDMEDAYGPLDGIKDRMEEINGEVELLSGQRNALRLKGGGSDVLGPFTDQIEKLTSGQSGASKAITEMQKLQDEIDKLGRQSQRLNLERDLKFDGLTRQIEQAANSAKEFPFAQVIAGVKSSKAEVDRLTIAYDKQNAIVEAQELKVNALQAVHDDLQDMYDIEKQKLDDLGKAYDGIQSMIDEMISSLNGVAQAAKDAEDDLAALWESLGEGDFEIPGGLEGLLDPQKLEDLLDDWKKEWDKKFGKLDLDFTKPFKEAWANFKAWWSRNWTNVLWWILSPFTKLPFELIKWVGPMLVNAFKEGWRRFKEWWDQTAWPFLTGLPGMILGALAGIPGAIMQPFKDAWKIMGGGEGSIPYQLGRVVGWFIVLPFKIIGALLGLGGMLMGVFADAFMKVWRNIPNWWRPIQDWFEKLPGRVIGFVSNLPYLLWGWMKNSVEFLMRALPSLWDGVYDWFKNLPTRLWDWIKKSTTDLGRNLKEWLGGIASGALEFFKGIWDGIGPTFAGPINWVIRNVINQFGNGINKVLDILHLPDNLRVPHVDEVTVPKKHTGGIVGQNDGNGYANVGNRRANEELVMMLRGEGVVPRDVMAQLTPSAFQALRRGDSDVIAALQGKPTTVAALDLLKGPGQPSAQTGGLSIGDLNPIDVIRDAADAAGKLASEVVKQARELIVKTVRPLITGAMNAGDRYLSPLGVPGAMIKGMMHRMGDGVLDWLGGVDENAANNLLSQYAAGQSQNIPIPTKATLADVAGAQGKRDSYKTLIGYMNASGVPFIVTSTTGGRHVPGSFHYQGRAVDLAGKTPGWDSPQLRAIFDAFRPIEGMMAELIHANAPYNIDNGRRVSPYAVADHHDHVHAALEAGAMIRRTPGGISATLGEGRYNEFVSPLPPGFNMGRLIATLNRVDNALAGGDAITAGATVSIKKEYNFHGDLSFPNIKSSSDAEKFIRNLEALVD